MKPIILTSPLQGWASPLEAVPDPVFAERMMGDGIAVDPTGDCLHAPCDAVVLSVHASGHAITLRTPEGAEILMHIGLDTVALGGRGFSPCVTEGASVQRLDPLIRFDLDLLVCEARAVITPVIVTNPERFTIVRRETGKLVGVGEAVMTLEPRDSADVAVVEGDTVRRTIVVPLVHGIHARPAARIGEIARKFVSDVKITKDEREGNVRSPVALMALGVKLGDEITLAATGPDAADALAAIGDLILGGMGEKAGAGVNASASPASTAVFPREGGGPGITNDGAAGSWAPAFAGEQKGAAAKVVTLPADGRLPGVTASPGIAIGQAGLFRLAEIAVTREGAGATTERAALDAALALVADRLASKSATATGAERSILSAHTALLDDPTLTDAAHAAIAQGDSAAYAWRTAIRGQADALKATGDARLAERADDMLDLERQVLRALAGEDLDERLSFPPGTILLADDLLPSHLLGLDTASIVGFCVERGGPTSHVAILAATMGLPALVAVGPALAEIAAGTPLILDAGAGLLHVAPDSETQAAAQTAFDAQTERRRAALANAAQECRTQDGVRIEAFANLGSADDADAAVRNGAEGCGLLRTEFLFLERDSAPSVAEQTADYQRIADTLDGRPLIVRLLDIGGDKPAPYLPIAAEENPALGLRGIRVGLAHPEMLDAQLRAILAVRPAGQCRIMVPMIASLAELRAVRTALDAAAAATGHTEHVALGIMIETPAAAVTADLLASEADFLSIGTNDLTQYALAMDRGNPAVASDLDGLHPAVLRLIARTCEGGAVHGKWTGVCGGLASDPLAVPILIGLGVTELSSAPALVPEIKALVATLTIDACRAHAAAAMNCISAADVRTLARSFRP
ncbi:phosphocarrier protein HPr /phosphoenolpyruvate--protein phosphotransferase /PTS system IIA component (Glc family) [Sphingomonas sp. PP-F2F-G114-C0414]|uniref:phosphoenolpyruvate--protein phosphotransferase n=1 Tax=Sphingomonas sp. PP-F2F-G114-C0414 TaxID=2135662 RepID=UPI000EF85ABF|nr:phosphoenolpyruvate--protein phosphotransferase [Sphingomonas sp. PP-F2F-G114-C0414]RMB36726.1 phosphocarrier protein HPr /phosphoenolpyruvate--protein phosphotransferase /PTS system IIA component (Glc family) [Sphingomonas sp. PP-F2F-G114-C0414]